MKQCIIGFTYKFSILHSWIDSVFFCKIESTKLREWINVKSFQTVIGFHSIILKLPDFIYSGQFNGKSNNLNAFQ